MGRSNGEGEKNGGVKREGMRSRWRFCFQPKDPHVEDGRRCRISSLHVKYGLCDLEEL